MNISKTCKFKKTYLDFLQTLDLADRSQRSQMAPEVSQVRRDLWTQDVDSEAALPVDGNKVLETLPTGEHYHLKNIQTHSKNTTSDHPRPRWDFVGLGLKHLLLVSVS